MVVSPTLTGTRYAHSPGLEEALAGTEPLSLRRARAARSAGTVPPNLASVAALSLTGCLRKESTRTSLRVKVPRLSIGVATEWPAMKQSAATERREGMVMGRNGRGEIGMSKGSWRQ